MIACLSLVTCRISTHQIPGRAGPRHTKRRSRVNYESSHMNPEVIICCELFLALDQGDSTIEIDSQVLKKSALIHRHVLELLSSAPSKRFEWRQPISMLIDFLFLPNAQKSQYLGNWLKLIWAQCRHETTRMRSYLAATRPTSIGPQSHRNVRM